MAEHAVCPRSAAFVVCTLVLAAAAGVSAPAAARTGKAAAAAPVHAWLYTDRVTWHTAPGTHVTAQMFDRWSGEAPDAQDADADGNVTFEFGASPHDRVEPGAQPNLVEPLDDVTLLVDGETVVDVSVPFLTADVSIAPARVFGTAPGGATVAIALAGPDRPPFAATATADIRGAFSLDLAGRFELRYGDVGTATVTDAAGNVFTVLIAPLAVEVTLGASRFAVQASTSPVLDARAAAADPATGSTKATVYDYAQWLGDEPFVGGRSTFAALDANALATAIGAGSRITVTQIGPPLAAGRTHVVVVPDLSIGPDAARTALAGRAPAGAAVRIVVDRPGEPAWRADATADAAGVVRVALADRALGPGSVVEMRYDDGGGNTFLARYADAQLTIRPSEGQVDGLAAPGRSISLTVRSRALPRPWTFTTVAGDDGGFHLQLEPGNRLYGPRCVGAPWCRILVRPGAGDVIAAEFDERGPQRLTLPPLTTRTDPDSETISGVAAPGATVSIYTASPWPAPADPPGGMPVDPRAERIAQVRADAAGRYRAALGPAIDIEPPMHGVAVVDAGSGLRVAEAWQPFVLDVYLGESTSVHAVPDTSQPMTATLRDADGRVLSADEGYGGAVGPVDRLGQGIEARAGDTLTAARGGDTVSLVVPPLDGRIDPVGDVVIGQGPPGASVLLTLPGDGTVAVPVGADGAFRYDARSRGVDLRYGDTGSMEVRTGPGARHSFRREIDGTGLFLRLPAARLKATLDAPADAAVEVLRDGRALLRQSVPRVPRENGFSRQLGVPGHPPTLGAGDVIAVRAVSPPSDATLSLTVPPLTIVADAATDRVGGFGPPNARLSVRLGSDFPIGGSGWPNVPAGASGVRVGPDGTWALEATSTDGGPVDILPGARLGAWLRLPDGHGVEQDTYVPLLSTEVDGRRVCGVAAPFAPVHVEALDAQGAATLRGDSSAREDGLFAFTLADASSDGTGRHPVMAPGTRVDGRLGEAQVAVTVPPLAASIDGDLEAGFVSVHVATAPDREVTVNAAARGCLGHTVRGDGLRWVPNYGRSDRTGTLTIIVYAANAVVATYTADGMRAFRDLGGPIAAIRSGSAHVAVTATVGTNLTARLTDAAGALRASAAATANDEGRADVRLVGASGLAVAPAGGDMLTLVDDGGSVPIAIEPLDIDLVQDDARRTLAVVGAAQSGRAVRVHLALADGRRIDLDRVADAAGRFGIAPADMSPRGAWRLGDVVGVQAVVTLAGGHRLIGEAFGGRVWLPVGFVGR